MFLFSNHFFGKDFLKSFFSTINNNKLVIDAFFVSSKVMNLIEKKHSPIIIGSEKIFMFSVFWGVGRSFETCHGIFSFIARTPYPPRSPTRQEANQLALIWQGYKCSILSSGVALSFCPT